jgi:hypothetical protein
MASQLPSQSKFTATQPKPKPARRHTRWLLAESNSYVRDESLFVSNHEEQVEMIGDDWVEGIGTVKISVLPWPDAKILNTIPVHDVFLCSESPARSSPRT